jgi:hypothetical protein
MGHHRKLSDEMLSMHLLLFFSFAFLLQPVVRGASSSPPHDCPNKCGDVNIEYPFGIGPGCALEEGFELHCNKSQDGQRNTTYLFNMPVANILLLQGQVRVMSYIASMCHNRSTTTFLDLAGTPFTVSEKENVFTVVGVDTLGLMAGTRQSAIVSTLSLSLSPHMHAHTHTQREKRISHKKRNIHYILLLAAGYLQYKVLLPIAQIQVST